MPPAAEATRATGRAARVALPLIAAFFAARACLLVYPDLNLTYPFLVPDSYDWIANGLSYCGYGVHNSLRPPALPLLIAGLEKTNLLNILPAVNQIVLFCLLLLSYRILAARFQEAAAIVATLFLFCNHFLLNLSLYILADLYAMLFILLGYQSYLAAAEDERRYVSCALLFSLSFLFQYAVVFVVPALAAHYLAFRRRAGAATLCRACLPPLVLAGGWLLYRRSCAACSFSSGIRHVGLLRLHADGALLYLVGIAAVLGVPGSVAALFGIVRSFSEAGRRREFLSLNAIIALAWFVFWALLYDWNDRRFVLYLLFFLLPFVALAIESMISSFSSRRLFGKAASASACLLLLAGSALCYESAFDLGTVKLTPFLAAKFPVRMDPVTSRSAMTAATFSLARERRGFNQLNLKRLYDLRRAVDLGDLARLEAIRRVIDARNRSALCVAYDRYEGYRWYVDRNRYGNHFRRALHLCSDSEPPDLWIIEGRLRLGPGGRRTGVARGPDNG